MNASIRDCMRLKTNRFFIYYFVTCLVLVLGCGGERPAERPAVAPPTPEERFENLVAALKRQYDVPLPAAPFVPSVPVTEPGVPVISTRTKNIEHKLIEPTEEGSSYKGIVTIATQSTTTTLLPIEEKKEEKQENEASSEGVASVDSDGLGGLIRTGNDPVTRLGTSPLKTVETENIRTLEFEFREGAWILLTEIDEENEPFTATAVEYALKRQ